MINIYYKLKSYDPVFWRLNGSRFGHWEYFQLAHVSLQQTLLFWH